MLCTYDDDHYSTFKQGKHYADNVIDTHRDFFFILPIVSIVAVQKEDGRL